MKHDEIIKAVSELFDEYIILTTPNTILYQTKQVNGQNGIYALMPDIILLDTVKKQPVKIIEIKPYSKVKSCMNKWKVANNIPAPVYLVIEEHTDYKYLSLELHDTYNWIIIADKYDNN